MLIILFFFCIFTHQNDNTMKVRLLKVSDYVLLFIVGMTLASLKPFGWLNVIGIIVGSASMIVAVIIDYRGRYKK